MHKDTTAHKATWHKSTQALTWPGNFWQPATRAHRQAAAHAVRQPARHAGRQAGRPESRSATGRPKAQHADRQAQAQGCTHLIPISM